MVPMNSTAAALADNYRRAAHALRNGQPAQRDLMYAATALDNHPVLLDALRHEATILDANHQAAIDAFTAGDLFTDPAAAAAAASAYDRVADVIYQ